MTGQVQPGSSPADVVTRLAVGELTWDDLMVAEPSAEALRSLTAQAATGGLVVAVHGPSGVGKTFAVRVWAESMRLDLWRVDCAALVARHGARSPSRGLAEALAFGERPHAVLLFHDAAELLQPGAGDALAALLTRTATRRAPTVLETRSEGWPALAVRLPEDVPVLALHSAGPELRRRLWERLVARTSPLSGPDLDALAALEVPGAVIDAAVRAVLLEQGDERLETEALLAAARALAAEG